MFYSDVRALRVWLYCCVAGCVDLICKEFEANRFIEMHAFHLCSLHFTHNNILGMICKITARWLISYNDYRILTVYLMEIERKKTPDKFADFSSTCQGIYNRVLTNSAVGYITPIFTSRTTSKRYKINHLPAFTSVYSPVQPEASLMSSSVMLSLDS